MIPLKLELRNFMSYGADGATLDMTGLHTLCLAGENGNGKSALLDAITWALWGESRAGKNKHEDLIRIGADEMSVALTFSMDGQTYRVLRKRSKKASGSVWQLQQEGDDGAFSSRTGDTERETEARIQKLLHMNYDTFINSAYLRQGQADQFVQQTPGKRKEILGDILDLSRYDQLELRARDKAKAAAAEAVELERDLGMLDAEIAEEAAHAEAVTELQARLDAFTAQGETNKAEMYSVLARIKDLEGAKAAADTLRRQRDAYAAELGEYATERAAVERDLAGAQALLARQEAIDRDYTELLTLRVDLENLEADRNEWFRGSQALTKAQGEWDAAELAVQARVRDARARHEDAIHAVKDLPTLREEQEEFARRVAAYDKTLAEEPKVRKNWTAAQERYARLKEQDAALNAEAQVWQKRLSDLAGQEGVCTVCNAPLTPERAAAVQGEYQDALENLAACRKDGQAEGARAKAEWTTLDARLADLEAVKKERADADRRLAQADQELVRVEAIAATVPRLAAALAEEMGTLSGGAFAPELQGRLNRIRNGLKQYAGIEDRYDKAKSRAAELAPADRLYLELAHAQRTLETSEARLVRIAEAVATRETALADAAQQLVSLADAGPVLADAEARREHLKATESARRLEDNALRQELGRHQHALDRCAALRVTRDEKHSGLSSVRRTQEVHEQLTRAFGKKGVQALIIDNALPELQDEANRLLERLTDGDMSLYINTLKESKSRKNETIETLDIVVSDSLGTRPLEMYSGGEGFRAAFALRIALSKLLARRAGAKLQTLIIDEGFGTQDGKGREKLVDALAAISQDFEKIIVITHIDELKDSFPARIEVVKTPTGSQITLMEGGAG